MKLEKDTVRRMGIFVFYDPEGKVDTYVSYLLKNLVNSFSEVITICNGKLLPEGRRELERYSNKVICRENKGYDVVAWKRAILDYVGRERLEKFDELILFNDTFYGPIYSFDAMFDDMNQRDIDFWGITSHHEALDGFEKSKYGYISDFIQSYFMAFRKSLISSDEFFDYWEAIPDEMEYQDAVHYHEAICTQTFYEQGYKWDTYIHTDELRVKRENSICYNTFLPDYMVEKKKSPILRRKIFVYPYDEYISYSGGETLARCLGYIEKNTDYDTDMIWENLLRLYNVADLKQSLHLNYVLPNQYCDKLIEPNIKVAVIIHSYYPDMLDEIYHYAQQVPEFVDLYITTGTEEKKKLIEAKFEHIVSRNFKVIQVKNRGRDLAALLVGCKDIVNKYQYVCFTHDKKTSGNMGPLPIGKSFFYTAIENVLSSSEYICNIINTFVSNKRLGIIAPPGPVHNIYFGSIGREWTICYDETEKLMKKIGVKANINPQKQPFVLGTSLWFRTEALEKLFAQDFDYVDFPPEPLGVDGTISHALERSFPYVAQEKGFYSAWVMTEDYASLEISNLRYLLSNVVNVQQEKHFPNIEHYYKHYMLMQSMEPVQVGTLYYDLGEGYSEENISRILYKLNADGEFQFEFHIPQKYQGKIKGLRFDPIEEKRVLCMINKIQCEKTQIHILNHNGMDMVNGYQWFDSGDPCYFLKADDEFSDMKICGNITEISQRLANDLVECYHTNLVGLFWDVGNGFSEEQCIRRNVIVDGNGNFNIKFDLDVKETIIRLRFDPVEGCGCYVKINKFLCDGNSFVPDKHNGYSLKDGGVGFKTDDPYFIVEDSFGSLNKIEIEGEFCKIDLDKRKGKKSFFEKFRHKF